MTDKDYLMEDLCKAEERYSNIMKRWTRAYNKFKEIDEEKLVAEQLVMTLKDQLEVRSMEDGTFHDQMASDFNIDKYGREKKFIDIHREHNAQWDRCSCVIQCPSCKKYNVKMEYKLMRNVFGGDRILFDIKPLYGKKIGAYYYCKDCEDEVSNNE